LGMVGLGRMGANMARRLIRGGHEIVGYASDPAGVKAIGSDGGTGTTTLDDFVRALRPPRVAWVMVPAGAATEQVVTDLAKRMAPGDTIVDGGNSFYKDDVRRMKMLRPQQIHYVDVGTSGGVWGRERESPRAGPEIRAEYPGYHGAVASRVRGELVAPGLDRSGARRESVPVELHGCGRRLGRGPVDGHGSRRGGRAGRRPLGFSLCALPLAPGPHLRLEGALGHAAEVRRPRRAAGRVILAGDVGGTKTALALFEV